MSRTFTFRLDLSKKRAREIFLEKYEPARGRRLANLLGFKGPNSVRAANGLMNYAQNMRASLVSKGKASANYRRICQDILVDDILPFVETSMRVGPKHDMSVDLDFLVPEALAERALTGVDRFDGDLIARLCQRARETWSKSKAFRAAFDGDVDERDVLIKYFRQWTQEERLRWVNAKKPWEEANKLKVMRHDYLGGETIDPGVNFFVLTLEHLGARPKYSCEGHPCGFYVFFQAPIELVLRIRRTGYFSVQVGLPNEGDGGLWWSIRLDRISSEAEKRQTLNWAAQAWQKEFWKRRIRNESTTTM